MVNVARFKMFKGTHYKVSKHNQPVMDKVSDQDDDKVDAKCKKEIKHLTTVYSLINSIANTTCICGEQEQLNTVTQQMKIQILM